MDREGQYKVKNYYYYSFKTRLGSQSEATFRLWTGRVNLFNLKKNFKNNQSNLNILIYFFFKMSTGFWPRFYPELTWLFYWVRSSWSFFFYFFLNSSISSLGLTWFQVNLPGQFWFYNQGYYNIINFKTQYN